MLLRVNPADKTAQRVMGARLKDFGLKETDFQAVLYQSLGEDELLLIMRSRAWRTSLLPDQSLSSLIGLSIRD